MFTSHSGSNLKTVAAAGLSAVLLAACVGNDVESLKNAKLSGDEYRDKLAANYADFANYEYTEMYDGSSAAHFAKKGMTALKGGNVQPEQPERWNISNTAMLGDLNGARTRLIAALNKGAAAKLPAETARALVSYDCWVEQSSEGWQYNDILGCRDGFNRSMAAIDTGLNQPAPVAAIEREPAPPVANLSPPATPAQYLLFFDWDSAQVNAQARQIVQTAGENARKDGVRSFVLVGHADSSGPDDYNQRLSVRRAQAVADVLVQMGFGRSDIRISGRGERDLLVPTADGVREPQNRRVLITIASRHMGA